jgi:hypothetical protein
VASLDGYIANERDDVGPLIVVVVVVSLRRPSG